MSIIYVMIPLALVLVAVAVGAMIWAVRTGQFDELESHGWTPVLDDDERPIAEPRAEPGAEPGAEPRAEPEAESGAGDPRDDAGSHDPQPESIGDRDRP